jgi:hypothetical protein
MESAVEAYRHVNLKLWLPERFGAVWNVKRLAMTAP